MIFITSISPGETNRKKQQDAVASWEFYKKDIFSVNTTEEVRLLEDHFPAVHFIPCNRTAKEVYGKDLMYVYDIIKIGFLYDESLFLINSDIILDPKHIKTGGQAGKATENLVLYSEYMCKNSLVAFRRWDKTPKKFEPWMSGFDAFALHVNHFGFIKDMGFVLGQCWWDWWLPFSYFVNRKKIWVYDQPFLVHYLHERSHDVNQWTANLENFRAGFAADISENNLYTKIIDAAINANSRSINKMDIVL